jgi:hypothetical protein
MHMPSAAVGPRQVLEHILRDNQVELPRLRQMETSNLGAVTCAFA